MAAPSTEPRVVSKFLYENIFCQFGLPTHILTDNASSFDNHIIEGFLNLVQVHQKFSAPYRPQTNGRVEQMNGNLMNSLKKLSTNSPMDWDENLAAVVYAYRTKAHSVLKVSPFKFMYGQAPPSSRQDPLQLLGKALGNERFVELTDRNIQTEDYNALEAEIDYEPKKLIPPKYFYPGTKVLRVRHNKFNKMDTNMQPEVFTVVAYFSNGSCQLADQQGLLMKRRVNVGSLRQMILKE